jgi:hypothetical protein
MAVEQSLSMGGSYVLDALWKRLELDTALKELLSKRSFEIEIERLVFALVANRALAPRSKLGMERWVGRKVHIDGLEGVQSHTLYRVMDFLVDHGEEIQRSVFFSVATLLNLEVDLLFFDTTSSYFEVEEISLVKLCGKDGRVELVSNLTEDQRNILKKLSVNPPRRVKKLAQTA